MGLVGPLINVPSRRFASGRRQKLAKADGRIVIAADEPLANLPKRSRRPSHLCETSTTRVIGHVAAEIQQHEEALERVESRRPFQRFFEFCDAPWSPRRLERRGWIEHRRIFA